MKHQDYIGLVGAGNHDEAISDLFLRMRAESKTRNFAHAYRDLSPTLRAVMPPDHFCLHSTPLEREQDEALVRYLNSKAITQRELAGLSALITASHVGSRSFRLDSMGMCGIEVDGIPTKSEDAPDDVPGYKLKPNATSMYQQFVARNHKR